MAWAPWESLGELYIPRASGGVGGRCVMLTRKEKRKEVEILQSGISEALHLQIAILCFQNELNIQGAEIRLSGGKGETLRKKGEHGCPHSGTWGQPDPAVTQIYRKDTPCPRPSVRATR